MKNIYLYPTKNKITKEAFHLGGLAEYNILGAIEKVDDEYMILENGKDEIYAKLDNEKIRNSDAIFIIENDENSIEIASTFLSLDKSIIKLNDRKKIKNQCSNTFTVFINNTHNSYSVAKQLVKIGYQVDVLSNSIINQLVATSSIPDITIIDTEDGTLNLPISYPCMVFDCEGDRIKSIKTYQSSNEEKELLSTSVDMEHCEIDIVNYIKNGLLINRDISELIKADILQFRKGERNQYNLFSFSNSYFLFEANTRTSYTLEQKVYEFLNIYFIEESSTDIYLSKKINEKGGREFLIRLFENFSNIRYNSKLYGKRLEYKILDDKNWKSGESIVSFIGKKVCNLSCKYCFMEEKEKDNLNKEELSEELIRAGLDFILQWKDNSYRVRADYSLGGEPLLTFDTYKKLWSIVKEYDEKEEGEVALGFITNATLLNDETIEWFNKYHQWIGFSLDGGKKVHDSMRIYSNGGGSFDKAYSNIKKVLNLNWDHFPGVNSVLTAENPDILSIFLELWELGFRIITIKPVRADSSKTFAITLKNIKIIKENYLKFAEFLIQHAKQGNFEYLKAILVPFDFFGRFLMRVFMRDRVIIKRCPGGNRIFSIRNNGDIYPCDSFNGMDAFKMGNLKDNTFDPTSFVPEKVTEARRCKDCWARYLCGGVCSYTEHINSCSQDSSSDAECELEKYLIMLSCYVWSEIKNSSSKEDIDSIKDYIKLMTGGSTW